MKEKIEHLLSTGFERKASDIHITVGVPPILRINGELQRYGTEAILPEDTEGMAKAIIPAKLWDDFKSKGELDFSYGIPGISRFRVNAYHQRGCVSLAARVVPTTIPTLEELELPSVLKKIAEKPQGLVLVTGPTGSGKSTTLAAMIQYMNKNMSKHIVTLEDPIEYLHKHGNSIIDQREVGFDTNNFANGLRAALRQDPDVMKQAISCWVHCIHQVRRQPSTGLSMCFHPPSKRKSGSSWLQSWLPLFNSDCF